MISRPMTSDTTPGAALLGAGAMLMFAVSISIAGVNLASTIKALGMLHIWISWVALGYIGALALIALACRAPATLTRALTALAIVTALVMAIMMWIKFAP